MAMSLTFGASAHEGMENFRRAVLRAPPSRFKIELLDMSKDGGSHNHGMRIHPVFCEESSIASQSSILSQSSITSHRAYDIWRRWEDCLRFQETLETEYERAAIEKRQRLLQGKGVKGFNGIYKNDLASSWDSLPSGPDPKSIAQDIHQHLPTLTKRGTIFRPGPSTIERRRKELQALIDALFSSDMPALIQEIRATDIVTDFFGVWRRDYDQALKRHSSPQSSTPSNTAPSSSVFDSYFSTSNPSLIGSYAGKSSSSLSSSARPRTSSGVSSRRSSDQSHPSIARKPRPRASSSTVSSEPSSAVSEISYESRSSRSSTTTVDSDFLALGNDPHTPDERPGLDVLPEEPEMSNKLPDKYATFVRQRPRTTESRGDHGRQFARPLTAGGHPVQETRQKTSTSIDAVKESMEGLNLTLANAMKEHFYSQPMGSISALILADSTDPNLPQLPATPTPGTKFRIPSRPRILIPVSPPSPGTPSDIDDRPVSLISDRSWRPKTPVAKPTFPRSPVSPYDDSPASPVCSLAPSRFSTSTTQSSSGLITLKVAHDDSIIMLRVPRDASLADLRDKVYNKFVNQENIPLSRTFSIALAPPLTAKSDDPTKSQILKGDTDWESLLSTMTGTKLSLHVHNSMA